MAAILEPFDAGIPEEINWAVEGQVMTKLSETEPQRNNILDLNKAILTS